MISKEPREIMGVMAFPETDREKRRIRFIDSNYRELFAIKDEESIVIKRADGSEKTYRCRYIDDCHTLIGSRVYHICEFAQIAERNQMTCRPSENQARKPAQTQKNETKGADKER